MTSPLRISIALFVALAAMSSNAEVYQWKDASGKTIISDKPPIGVSQVQNKGGASAPSSSASQPKSIADRELEFRKRQKDNQEAAEKTAKQEKEATEKKENCVNARRQLQVLESGERISTRNENGERYFLDDAQREQEATKARQIIQSQCSP